MFHGSPSGLSNTPDWTAEGNQAGAFFGRSGSFLTTGFQVTILAGEPVVLAVVAILDVIPYGT